jgi:biotin transporter BioY
MTHAFSCKSILTMVAGTAIILFLGVGKLTYDYDLTRALTWGLYPFLWGALIKIILGGIISAMVAPHIGSVPASKPA